MSDADDTLAEKARELLRAAAEAGGETPAAADLDTTEELLSRAGPGFPVALRAELMVFRGATLARLERVDDALLALGEASARFADAEEPEVVQVIAFAWLTRASVLTGAGRIDESAVAGRELLHVFEDRAGAESLAGIGTMLLDVTFWLLAAERDENALEICTALIRELADGNPAERTVAAGARFFAGQAAGRVGDLEGSRSAIEALCEMGEPALAALNRIATQFGPAEANPTWHAQIAATTVTVLWRLGRIGDARALAQQAAASFERLGMPVLERMLFDLDAEIAAR